MLYEVMRLRQSEVNRILGTVDELSETEEEINVPYFVGETVKVIDGPFNGFNGLIEDVNEEKKKLKVMVKIFGRKTPLDVITSYSIHYTKLYELFQQFLHLVWSLVPGLV